MDSPTPHVIRCPATHRRAAYERLVPLRRVELHADGSGAGAGKRTRCLPSQDYDARRASGYNAMARLAAGRIEAFAAAAGFLRAQGLSAPEIYAIDTTNGLLVSEDLGDGLFARLIDQGQEELPLYLSAVEALARLHELTPPDILEDSWPLLTYDDLALKTGADLFVEWYPRFDTSHPLSAQAATEWEALWAPLRQRAEAGASVFAHRDYHAENLLWLPSREGAARVGMIDFQDALRAHPSWDLLSLLHDARRDVSKDLEDAALDHYFSLRPGVDRGAFMRDYTALAVLNESRILGIFSRLVVRDHKPRYEAFMPRMWRHIADSLNMPGMEGLRDWFLRYGFNDKLHLT